MPAVCDVMNYWSVAMTRLGTIRSLCLIVLTFTAIILLATSYVDRYEAEICADRVHRRLSLDRRKQFDADDDVDEKDDNNGRWRRSPSNSGDSLTWDYNWDVSADEVPPSERQNIPDRTLILVRHGQYDFQTLRLTELGREQAQITGQRLRQMNLSYSEIIHSTMDRAVETAQIIRSCLSDSVSLKPEEMLVEGGPIPPHPTISYWGLPQKVYYKDGPRMEAAFRKYFHRNDKSVTRETFQILVGHGNIFRFFVLRALQFPNHAWMRVFIAHASITVVHIRADGTVAMTHFGDAGHFPTNKVTF